MITTQNTYIDTYKHTYILTYKHTYIHTFLFVLSYPADFCPLFRSALLPRLVAMLYIRSDRRYQGRSPPQKQHDVQGHPDLARSEYVSWESPRSTSGRRHTHRQMDRYGQTWTPLPTRCSTNGQNQPGMYVCMYVCMYGSSMRLCMLCR